MDGRKPYARFFTDVPISAPQVIPEIEMIQMNGFAWTPDGLMVAFGDRGDQTLDELRRLREDDVWKYWESSTPPQGRPVGD